LLLLLLLLQRWSNGYGRALALPRDDATVAAAEIASQTVVGFGVV